MAAKIEFPLGSRSTRLRLKNIPSGTTLTQWHITPLNEKPFILTTDKSGGNGANILGGNLSYVDIWLPPFHNYELKTRHKVNGKLKSWSTIQEFTSRGPLNSFEKFQALSGQTALDNVVT